MSTFLSTICKQFVDTVVDTPLEGATGILRLESCTVPVAQKTAASGTTPLAAIFGFRDTGRGLSRSLLGRPD